MLEASSIKQKSGWVGGWVRGWTHFLTLKQSMHITNCHHLNSSQVVYCLLLSYLYKGHSIYNISIFHGCMVWIEKSVTRVTDRHHEACRVMPNSDPE